jgi:hypothetical protein
MIGRTVIAIEPMGAQTTIKLDDAPLVVPGLGDQMLIDLSTIAGDTPAERGDAVLNLLKKSDAIEHTLTNSLAAAANAKKSPLYFHIRARAADGVPWELLHHLPGGFCVLDPGLPIGRIATDPRPVHARPFRPPLRIVAVLSAAGRSGREQLTALLKLVASPAATTLGMQLHVISGEQAVLDAAIGPQVTKEMIGSNHPALAAQIASARPHLLHVLCHGRATPGEQVLSFAHFGDFVRKQDEGSVRMSAGQFAQAVLDCDPWLVVLSACESAAGSSGPALANRVVSEGVPAVIGMRRLVDLSTMDKFCQELYPEISKLVVATLADAGESEVRILEWASVLTTPRQVLSGADPNAADAWSDPVLYCQEREVQIFLPSAALSPHDFAGLSARRDTFVEIRKRLDPQHTPPEFLADIDTRIAILDAQLREVRFQ